MLREVIAEATTPPLRHAPQTVMPVCVDAGAGPCEASMVMSSILIHPHVLEAVQMSLGGERDAARERLTQLWESLDAGDAFHRCVVAHYLADLQVDALLELHWDRRALDAALSASGDSFDGRIPGVEHGSFLPSLYLNLAASYERVGELDAARQQASVALRKLDLLGSTPLAELTRGAVVRLCERLGVGR